VPEVFKFVSRRLAMTVVQVWILVTLVFFLLRLLPGDPSFYLAGPNATPESVAAIRKSLNLDASIWSQYVAYVGNFVQGDWGTAISTSKGVLNDMLDRFPATFELITAGIGVGALIMIPWAAFSALRPRSFVARVGGVYGRLAGAIPDFFLALVLILVCFTWTHIAPAPIGQVDVTLSPPDRITGMYTIDALLDGDWRLFTSALSHLVLPAATLLIVYTASFYRQMRLGMERELETTRVLYATACGLGGREIAKNAVRNALPPVIALIGNTYGYMIGGAVLIETIFSWGGLGQYARVAIQTNDYFAISGVVLVTSLFTLLVYMLVDIINAIIDPRVRAA
jgi:ABC-type dipeptide/oligopeptide/nickel transport system permease component